MAVRIGVLAVQGNVSEHIDAFREALEEAGCMDSEVVPVRRADEISGLDALAIPGGESTTISRLVDKCAIRGAIEMFQGGIFATCAGMVLLSTDAGDPRVSPVGLIDISVDRNAFGRQKESFEADLAVRGLDRPFHAIFIRAPVATRASPGCEVLARIGDSIVAVRQGKHMALSFHPELGHDRRLHGMFLKDLGIC